MKIPATRIVRAAALTVLPALAVMLPRAVHAQTPWGYLPSPTTPTAQQNSMSVVQSQVQFLQNATRTATGDVTGGYESVLQAFRQLQFAYANFKSTLNRQQLSAGANELADLDQGLAILSEVFPEYTQDVAEGQSSDYALSRMCRSLDEAAGVWWQQMQRDCQDLNVGW